MESIIEEGEEKRIRRSLWRGERQHTSWQWPPPPPPPLLRMMARDGKGVSEGLRGSGLL